MKRPGKVPVRRSSMSDLIKLALSRRQFLIAGTAVGGGLLVGCAAPPRPTAWAPTEFPAAQGEVALNGWVKIGPDGPHHRGRAAF